MKIIPVQVVVVIAMTLLVEAPVALESIFPTDLIRIQEKQLPYILMIIQVIQKLTLLLKKNPIPKLIDNKRKHLQKKMCFRSRPNTSQ